MTLSAKSVAPLRLSSTIEGEKACANKSRHLFSSLFENTRNVFKADELGLEIDVIALPAFMALASDPFALLVDTAFIGHLGIISHILFQYMLRKSRPQLKATDVQEKEY